jgi:uncharacterized protein YfaS (alpha-2-macroglobulin family)
MKTRFLFGVVALLAFAAGVLAGPRDSEWAKVDDAVKKGMPKTAIDALEPIISGALADKAYAEAIKAIARKIALEGNIQGNKPEEKILRLQDELAKTPAEMKPAMEAILAHWYWQYFQQNRWRFMQRTQTAEAPGPDLQTWDLAHILAEIDRHFTAALADEKTLKATPVSAYDDLLTTGSVPDRFRPTMFDFLAYDALQFYQAGEQGARKAEDEFELDADSPIFADAAEFASWRPFDSAQGRPEVTDDASPMLRAIRLYQGLLKFHEADADRSAFYDADLARLDYGHNKAVGEDKSARYQAALQRFIDATARHEISARALGALAAQVNEDGEPAKAHELAQRGLDAFPKSAGGAMCFNLIQQIEAKSAQLDTERVWNAPWPTLNVTYRNVTKVYFRAVAFDFRDYISQTRWGFGNVQPERQERLLEATPALAWNADLPPTRDFKQRTEQLPAPTSLKPGFYFILASHDGSFGGGVDQVSLATVWVSDLALVLQSRYDGRPQSGFVLQATSGAPVSGATVRQWQRNREGWFTPIDPVETDENGRFQLPPGGNQTILLAEHDGQSVANLREFYNRGNFLSESGDSQTVFFTDRALYRPGQTINYKGISIRSDQSAGKYTAIAGLKLTVVFNDPNGKEIARATHRTNDYGSFDGTFTAPRDRLMGRMTIQVLGRPSSTSISVEEYKRPKFQVELKAPAEAAKLGAPVQLTGKGTAYTGAAIGGAKVKWRVERGVQCPYWCWWWQPAAPKAIAHGAAVTEADGTFKLQFNADPDRTVPVKNEPIFVYTIHADVTDTTGETRSSDRTVRAGYTALQASLGAGEWQTPDKPVEFNVATQSLDGDPQPAQGTVTIYALQQPAKVERTEWHGHPARGFGRYTGETPVPPDPTNPDSWELGQAVAERPFATDATGKTQIAAPLKAGIYRAALETKDRFGKTVTARRTVQVIDPQGKHYGVKLPNFFTAPKWSVEPGENFSALWGTGYDAGRAFVELECDGKPLQSYWTAADRTQQLVELPITEKMRGGVTLRVTYVRENRAYFNERIVDVPWSNQQLTVKWESFRSKLTPGQKETWTAVVTGPDAKRTAAEMVATLYDASLDQFLPHNWPQGFNVFRRESGRVNAELQNAKLDFQQIRSGWRTQPRGVDWRYRSFPPELTTNLWGYDGLSLRGAPGSADEVVQLSPFAVSASAGRSYKAQQTMSGSRLKAEMSDAAASISVVTKQQLLDTDATNGTGLPVGTPQPDLSKVTARKNLNETAFFFPHLLADDDGVVKIQFTMPEALTEWKFLGFAHDAQLRAGFLTDKAVTAKDLMVEPNPPRFVREGDALEFTVKVSNQSDQPQTGKVKLTFADAATEKSVDDALGNRAAEQAFDIPAKQSRSYSWRIAVPDGMGFLTYKAVGATKQASDGEEGFLPVLSRRILVTESLPLPIRGRQTKEFEFKKLLESGKSDTLRSQSLTVQMVSQPAWYAVVALPYLMEYPYECSEQIFNRYYANALARHIANSDPKIRRIFDLWKGTPALDSPLTKNQDLKSVMLEETPWLRQANQESQARRNVGLLFDGNRLDEETARTLSKLSEQQFGEGLWSWFPGGRPSEYISLYITTGFGRLRHLGVDVDVAPAIKALGALDAWMDKRYREIRRQPNPDDYVPGHLDAIYLYGRSFFLKDRPIAAAQREAVDFFLGQSRKFWLRTDCRMCQAQLALALQRFGDKETPPAIMKSLKERSVSSEELGMFWRDQELSWWWYRAPIEAQATMIEAFAEVAEDAQAVEDCKVWLLKQKQTQDWKTTKATADAIYGLLLRGDKLLSSDALVEVALGGETIKPEKVEAGTGFYEQKFVRNEIKPAMGQITVKKVDDGVSWGSVHWQYLEDMSKVTPHEGTPLKLKKTLFVKETTGKGQVLKAVTGPLSVGDELVVRIELRTDRDMEYVHLKDQRGSGTEPVNVLSRYKYQDGLAYYESTRDTASHFFIDYLPKGVYVFEYSTRVQLKGRYQTGIAEIQCMYAPEFNSHSESFVLEVK